MLIHVQIVHKDMVLAGVMEIADGLMQVLSQQLLTQQHRVSSLDLQVLDYSLNQNE